MNFDFGNILTHAWQIIWKHKILWIFGILASCTRGAGGGGGSNTGYQFSSGDRPPFVDDQFTRQMEDMLRWLSDNWWILAALVLALILISLAFYVIGFIGKISLIRGTYQAETGAQSLQFGQLFSESLPYFWRVFGLNFLAGLALAVAFLALFVPLVILGVLTLGLGLLCALPLVCLLIPLSWIVMVVLEQANAAIVIENLRMLDGLRRGWEIVKANVGPVVIMSLILLFGGGILSLIIAVPIFLAIFPLIPGLIAGELQRSGLLVAGLCFVAYLPVLLLLNGVLTAYIQSAWTLTYLRLTAPPEAAPVHIEANA